MKKLIAMLLVCALLFSYNIVWADSVPSLDFLKYSTSICDVEQNGTVNFKLNEPFGLIELLAEGEDSGAMSNHIDIAMLCESLFDSTMYVSSKTKMTDNGKMYSTETHFKSNVPFKVNDNLEGDARTNYSVWTELDFSDEENPYFNIIMTHPFAAKYITADSEMFLQDGGVALKDFLEVYKVLFEGETRTNLNDGIIESIKRNASVTGNSKKVRIAFTDIGLKMYLTDTIVSVLGELDGSMLEGFDAEIVTEALSKVPVFGNEAMVMEYTIDSKGRITEEKTTLNVDLNIYDLMSALGEEEPPEESGITRDNCKINFTVKSQNSFKYNSVKIEKPVLTEENSVDIFEYEDPYYYDEPEYDDENYYEEYYSPWVYANIDNSCYADGELKYVQLRSFLENMDYSISYDIGEIRAKTDSKYVKHKEFFFVVGSNVAYTESCSINMYVPLFIKDGVSYISVADCENITNLRKEALHYNFETQDGYLEFFEYEYLNGEE